MKLSLIILHILVSSFLFAQSENNELEGTWTVDLRPTPDSEAYYQNFYIGEINGTKFRGAFYGSPVQNGLLNTEWSRTYFAFSTSDSSNTYYHSGYLENGKLHGISYCPGRNFTSPWTAVKN